MVLDSKLTIVYGSRSVGGASAIYQIDGPYTLDKSFDAFRLVFSVVVTGTSIANLKAVSEDLEDDFRKRDQDLTITMDSSTWTYTEGVDLLNVTASLSKSGNADTDKGISRAYTCVVEGELPADDASPVTGLQDVSFNVDFEPGRQRILSMQGVYTATTTEPLASANYLDSNGADAEASTFLATFSPATFELVDEQYVSDRLDANCQFSRQYVELLANQSSGVLDDTEIRDHKMTFTDLSQFPGDSEERIERLRRVSGTYDCAVDIEQTTDLQAVYTSKIEPHVKALFETNFMPAVFTIEDRRVSYDETTKRVSVSIQFLYQKPGGTDVVEVTEATAYREVRQLDRSPLHNQDEFAAEIDVGWATLERIATRTVVAIGDLEPIRRLNINTPPVGVAGPIKVAENGKIEPAPVKEGWNLISNTSQVTDQWMGDPTVDQIKMFVLTETVVEVFNTRPTGGGV